MIVADMQHDYGIGIRSAQRQYELGAVEYVDRIETTPDPGGQLGPIEALDEATTLTRSPALHTQGPWRRDPHTGMIGPGTPAIAENDHFVASGKTGKYFTTFAAVRAAETTVFLAF